MNIFSIYIDTLSRVQLLRRVEEYVRTGKSLRISTVNPEFLLEARSNVPFADAIQSADIRVRDGFGTGLLFWLRGRPSPGRITGADLMEDFLEMADREGWTIVIANRRDGLSTFEEIQTAIVKKYPNIKIEGKDFDTHALCHSREGGNPSELIDSLDTLDSRLRGNDRENNPTSNFQLPTSLSFCHLSPVTCNLIFCSFGAPYQEIFLHELQKQNIPAVMMGVGGSFDYLTGKQKRAPKWMQKSGLEWLFRLCTQPNRVRRIFRAVILFPVVLLFDRLRHPGRCDTLEP